MWKHNCSFSPKDRKRRERRKGRKRGKAGKAAGEMIPPAPPRFCRRLRPRQHGEGNGGGAFCPAPVSPLAQCGRVLPNPTTVGSAVLLRRSADLKVEISGQGEEAKAVPWLKALENVEDVSCIKVQPPRPALFPLSRFNALCPLRSSPFFSQRRGERGRCFLSLLSTLLPRPVFPLCFFNDLGNATCLQAVAPEVVSRRNSFPLLNATTSVQAPQSVKRILHKRARAQLQSRNMPSRHSFLSPDTLLTFIYERRFSLSRRLSAGEA